MKDLINNKLFLQILNPCTKGILTITYILIFSFLCNSWFMSLSLVICLILLLFIIDKGNIVFLLASIKKIWLLLVIVGFFQGFVGKNYDFFSAMNAIFKIIGVYWTAIIYTNYSTQNELLYFWEICFKPLKIFGLSSSELALTMVIAIRFLPVFVNEIERIKMAQMARGAKLSNKSLFSVLNILSLIIPILTQAIMRSEELADAMEVRAYVPNRPRGRYKIYSFCKYDIFALFVSILILSFFIYFRIYFS